MNNSTVPMCAAARKSGRQQLPRLEQGPDYLQLLVQMAQKIQTPQSLQTKRPPVPGQRAPWLHPLTSVSNLRSMGLPAQMAQSRMPPASL